MSQAASKPETQAKVRREPDQAARLRALVQSMAADPGAGRMASAAAALQPAFATRPTTNSDPSVRRARWLVVASGKGGVGKTNIAVNLSIALARQGRRVTLLDADMGVANADVVCGLNPTARLDQVITRPGQSMTDLSIPAPGGFRLVPGSVGLSRMAALGEAERDQLLGAMATLEDDNDVLVVDASPGIGPLVGRLIATADLSLVVTTPEPTSITDAYALIKCASLGECGGGDPSALQLIVNCAADIQQAEAAVARLQAVCKRFLDRPLLSLGWIAQDPHVQAAVFARQPVILRSPRSPAARAIEQLARKLVTPLGLEGSRVNEQSGMTTPVVVDRGPRIGWWGRMMGRSNA